MPAEPLDESTARLIADLDYLSQLMLAGALPERSLDEIPDTADLMLAGLTQKRLTDEDPALLS